MEFAIIECGDLFCPNEYLNQITYKMNNDKVEIVLFNDVIGSCEIYTDTEKKEYLDQENIEHSNLDYEYICINHESITLNSLNLN